MSNIGSHTRGRTWRGHRGFTPTVSPRPLLHTSPRCSGRGVDCQLERGFQTRRAWGLWMLGGRGVRASGPALLDGTQPLQHLGDVKAVTSALRTPISVVPLTLSPVVGLNFCSTAPEASHSGMESILHRVVRPAFGSGATCVLGVNTRFSRTAIPPTAHQQSPTTPPRPYLPGSSFAISAQRLPTTWYR